MTDDQVQRGPELVAIPDEQVDGYLNVWATAWVSGYASCAAYSASVAGTPKPVTRMIGAQFEMSARRQMHAAYHDPITRNVIVDMIRAALTPGGRSPHAGHQIPITPHHHGDGAGGV